MPLTIRLAEPAGETFAQVIRHLPDGRDWLVSDPTGPVVIARNEGEEVVREAILSRLEEETDDVWDLECLASRGVPELFIVGLVALALASSIATLIWMRLNGPPGVGGLVYGLVLALTVPAGVITLGRRLVDPGRESRVEQNLERALRFAVAQVPGASIVER